MIILSARGEESDRVKGLTMGADDYVVKPFSLRELLARVDAELRRSTERSIATERYSYSHGVVDFERREVELTGSGAIEVLSEREACLMAYLLANKGRAISREEILRQVWGLDPKRLTTRTIDMHVAHLRGKLGDVDQTVVQAVRGQGYRIDQKLVLWEMLSSGLVKESATQKKYLETLRTESERLTHLVENVLALSRRLARAMKGDLFYEEVDQGACFVLKVPAELKWPE